MINKITAFLFTAFIATGLGGCSKKVTYSDVGPILGEKCAECHTGDTEGVVKSGFSVDSYDTVMQGTKLGAVIVPGSSASSSLYRMVAGKTDPAIHMPHGKNPLSDTQIETIQLWIDQGAVK